MRITKEQFDKIYSESFDICKLKCHNEMIEKYRMNENCEICQVGCSSDKEYIWTEINKLLNPPILDVDKYYEEEGEVNE